MPPMPKRLHQMAQTLTIKETCSGCGGTGNQPLHPSGGTSCFLCSGTGKRTVYEMAIDPGLDDVMDKLNDVMDKLDDIMEQLSE